MPPKRTGTVQERSAGAVVFHDAPDHPREYLLLRYGSGHWGFPKGHVEPGETDEAAARREVAEETSIPPESQRFIDGFIEPTRYTFHRGRARVEKEVLFFLVQALTRDVKLSAEHTTFTWLPFHAALARLTFDGPQRALRRAEAHLARATANA
jgi:bis(5'-nucleosidyl)-tetraphosphatase